MSARFLVLCCITVVACSRGDASASRRGTVREAPALPVRLALGRTPSDSLVHAWDIDVNPDGVGLPAGSGTHAQGAVVFAARCASCHGAHGEGIAPNPSLVGRDPRDGFPFGKDPKYVKTVGNYWPYATQNRLRRTIGHELAHGLGLSHNSCSIADSVMSIPSVPRDFPTVFAACTSDTGMSVSPTPSDVLPTLKSTYGNHVQTVCGF